MALIHCWGNSAFDSKTTTQTIERINAIFLGPPCLRLFRRQYHSSGSSKYAICGLIRFVLSKIVNKTGRSSPLKWRQSTGILSLRLLPQVLQAIMADYSHLFRQRIKPIELLGIPAMTYHMLFIIERQCGMSDSTSAPAPKIGNAIMQTRKNFLSCHAHGYTKKSYYRSVCYISLEVNSHGNVWKRVTVSVGYFLLRYQNKT